MHVGQVHDDLGSTAQMVGAGRCIPPEMMCVESLHWPFTMPHPKGVSCVEIDFD